MWNFVDDLVTIFYIFVGIYPHIFLHLNIWIRYLVYACLNTKRYFQNWNYAKNVNICGLLAYWSKFGYLASVIHNSLHVDIFCWEQSTILQLHVTTSHLVVLIEIMLLFVVDISLRFLSNFQSNPQNHTLDFVISKCLVWIPWLLK